MKAKTGDYRIKAKRGILNYYKLKYAVELRMRPALFLFLVPMWVEVTMRRFGSEAEALEFIGDQMQAKRRRKAPMVVARPDR